jgi:hypothetical protein
MLRQSSQQGVALAVSLLFLLVVTIVSITAATNSSMGLRMAGNLQESYESFQAAEAGIYGALALARTAEDPFMGVDDLTPFAGLSASTEHPLRSLRDGVGAVDVRVVSVAVAVGCPRPPGERDGDSEGETFACDYYRVISEHDVAGKARSRVELGVVKKVGG